MVLNGSFYFLYIVEFPEGTGYIEEIVAYEPYLIVAGRLKITD